MGFAAGVEDGLGLLPHRQVDDWCVGIDHGGLPEGQLSQVDAVVQSADDLVAGPLAARTGAVAPVVEHCGDGAGAEAVGGVEVEDQPHDHGLVLVNDEGVGGLVDLVAEGAPAAFPLSFGVFAFHAGDDAIDDGVASELGEHAEHLHAHATHGVEVSNGSVALRNTTRAESSSSSSMTMSRRLREKRSTR